MKLFDHKLSPGIGFAYGGSDRMNTRHLAGMGVVELFGLGAGTMVIGYLGRAWPAWLFMWALAVVLGMFCKWLTWRDAQSVGLPTPMGKTLGWFLLWLGMDGRAFFGRSADRRVREFEFHTYGLADKAVRVPAGEWLAAFFKLALGCVLIWIVGPRYFAAQPLLLGWCGMVGIILVLHFGVFHLLSLGWRAFGVNAAPIMNRPLAATSLAQLWGERWNRAFSIPARRLLLLPLSRSIGLNAASLVVFAVSGFMHEIVISVPARGGYGLPTAYFLLQGAGVWFERTKTGRALGFGTGIRGWLFTCVVAAGPVYWLFHPPFIRNVILPMLHAVGAT